MHKKKLFLKCFINLIEVESQIFLNKFKMFSKAF